MSDTDTVRINTTVERAWSLVKDARVYEARTLSEKLVLDTQFRVEEAGESNRALLEAFAHACHVAGYTVAMSTRNDEALFVIQYFQEMEDTAHILHDDVLLVIAQTYKGDMYRRYGDLNKALTCLQLAYTHTSQPDRAALGNCAQLLGRVYFLMNDMENFAKMMTEAEQIAHDIDPVQNSLHGQYCLGTVYIDYARSYSKLGQIQRALEYLKKAEVELPSTPHWSTLLTATRGILQVKNGDLEHGMPDVIKAVQLCYEHGNERLLEHLYELQLYLRKKLVEFSEAGASLNDALDRSFEF
jgi:tetratricopeptide (TPR) repeat protein